MNRRGLVFVVLMWVITALTSVAIYFAHSSRLAYLAAEATASGFQADHAAVSAVEYVRLAIETINTPGTIPDLEAEGYELEAVTVGDARFWLVGRDPAAIEAPSAPAYRITDEAGKLNINTADPEMLEKLPGMTAELAAAIVDWRDEDDDVSANGAESEYYLTLATPYRAKNAAFESIDELRLLAGADPEVLEGEDRNRNGVLDPNENDGDTSWPPDNEDGTLQPGILAFVTVHSREPNTRTDGREKVNLRGPSARSDLEELVRVTIGSGVFQQILANAGNDLGRPESVLEFYLESGLSETQFRQIEPSLTASPGDYRTGAINVATAPREVLACLPGVTEEQAIELCTAREALDAEQLKSVTWLTTVLDPDTCRLAGPHVTAQGWQVGIDVVAVGKSGNGFRRLLAVLDTEEGNVIYRRDMAREGWPLGDLDPTAREDEE